MAQAKQNLHVENNSVIGRGQMTADADGVVKIGDGVTGWNDLPVFSQVAPEEIPDDDAETIEGRPVSDEADTPEEEKAEEKAKADATRRGTSSRKAKDA